MLKRVICALNIKIEELLYVYFHADKYFEIKDKYDKVSVKLYHFLKRKRIIS